MHSYTSLNEIVEEVWETPAEERSRWAKSPRDMYSNTSQRPIFPSVDIHNKKRWNKKRDFVADVSHHYATSDQSHKVTNRFVLNAGALWIKMVKYSGIQTCVFFLFSSFYKGLYVGFNPSYISKNAESKNWNMICLKNNMLGK